MRKRTEIRHETSFFDVLVILDSENSSPQSERSMINDAISRAGDVERTKNPSKAQHELHEECLIAEANTVRG
jgi:hypothetical protein